MRGIPKSSPTTRTSTAWTTGRPRSSCATSACRAGRKGFAGLDIEGFRAYLHEMTGLGVLAPNNDQRGWHLRSPNVLRMISSRLDVLTELMHAESEPVPSEFIALATRRALPDGTRRR